MKKILMALMGATFLTTAAQAVEVPSVSYEEGGRCSTIHDANTGGINVVELSDYRKCVMIQHDIDTAFTYKTFWVRVGDQFTSFKVEDLAKLNKSERIEMIKTDVVAAQLLKNAEEQIVKLEAKYADLEKTHDVTIAELSAVNTLVDSLNVDLSEAGTVNEALSAKVDELTATLSATVDAAAQVAAALISAENMVTALEGDIESIKIERDTAIAERDARFTQDQVDTAILYAEDAQYYKTWAEADSYYQPMIDDLNTRIEAVIEAKDMTIAEKDAMIADLQGQIEGLTFERDHYKGHAFHNGLNAAAWYEESVRINGELTTANEMIMSLNAQIMQTAIDHTAALEEKVAKIATITTERDMAIAQVDGLIGQIEDARVQYSILQSLSNFRRDEIKRLTAELAAAESPEAQAAAINEIGFAFDVDGNYNTVPVIATVVNGSVDIEVDLSGIEDEVAGTVYHNIRAALVATNAGIQYSAQVGSVADLVQSIKDTVVALDNQATMLAIEIDTLTAQLATATAGSAEYQSFDDQIAAITAGTDIEHITTVDGLVYAANSIAGVEEHLGLAEGTLQSIIDARDAFTAEVTAFGEAAYMINYGDSVDVRFDGSNPEFVVTGARSGSNYSVTISVDGGRNTTVASLNNLGATAAITVDHLNEVAFQSFSRGFDEGYKSGFKDGYSEGYADGYADGYAAAKAE